MNPAPLERLLNEAWAWTQNNLLSPAGAAQAAVLLAAAVLSWLLWRLVRPRVSAWMERPASPSLAAFRQSAGRAVRPFFLALASGLAAAGFEALNQPAYLLVMVSSLSLAWVLIALITAPMEDRFWAGIVSLLIWLAAALNAVGLLKPTAKVLDSLALTLGDARVSVLGVLQAVVVLVLAMEAAVLVSRFVEARATRAEHLSPAMRVLLTKGARFGLYALAALLALSSMGVSLTSLAVVGGAVGVGIGFGLQKIFSNLVSGVILLLDKSIKPGDIIEVGGNLGSIQTLNARYALLRTLDGKEILVPNEELISGQVINWTRTDSTVRVAVPVGVAYDADVRLAMRLMEQAAAGVPRVLPEPPPRCLLTGFGESSVDLEVGVWITDPQNGLLSVRSEVFLAIWELFRAHNIEIPFPQRDITVKGLPEIRVTSEGKS